VFIPGLTNRDTISRFVADLRCPINILAVPGQASVAELNGLGVKRISLGSGPMRAGLGILSQIAEELKTSGTYSGLENAPSHLQIDELMRSYESQ
jgi:2-methylisocitrate lyase-like PEP mutase family enzyme